MVEEQGVKGRSSTGTAFIPGRYPHTYSADFIRGITEKLVLSRADAAGLLTVLSNIIGFSREEAAKKLARAYLEKYNPGLSDEDIAIAIEARRAETGTGSVHESAAIAQTPSPSTPSDNGEG